MQLKVMVAIQEKDVCLVLDSDRDKHEEKSQIWSKRQSPCCDLKAEAGMAREFFLLP